MALPGGALPGAVPEGSLSALLRADFAASLPPREESVYDAVQVLDGRPVKGEAWLSTARVDYTKDFYTVADWPHGQKPILPAVEQHLRLTLPGLRSTMTTVAIDAAAPARALKLTTSVQAPDGITTSQFQLWRTPPRQLYQSPHDGEGTGERVVEERAEGHFEEELPLLLRALDFRAGAKGTFFLYDSQTGGAAAPPTPWPARVEVRDGGGKWRATVEAADGRVLEYDFATAPPHALLEFRHSDGRSLMLRPETFPDGT